MSNVIGAIKKKKIICNECENSLIVSNSPHTHPSTHSTVGTVGMTCF